MQIIVVRQSLDPTSKQFVARLVRGGSVVMYMPKLPFQGAGKSPEEAVALLYEGYGAQNNLVSQLDLTTFRGPDGSLPNLGRALLNSASDTRNFLFHIDIQEYWQD